MNNYYKENNDIDNVALLKGIFFVILFTLILGYVYSMLNEFIPFIYVKIFITIGLGLMMGILLRVIYRLAKIRSHKSRIILLIVSLISVTYFQWSAFILSVFLNKFLSPKEYLYNLNWPIQSPEYFDLVGLIYENGVWGIGSGTYIVSGVLLLMVWLFEILIYSISPCKMVYNFLPFPFSEKLNKWYSKYTIEEDFEAIYSKVKIEKKLSYGIIDFLENLELGNGVMHSKVHIYTLAGESDQYLCLEKIIIEDGGRGKTRKENVIPYLKISNTDLNEIKKRFALKKEFIEIV